MDHKQSPAAKDQDSPKSVEELLAEVEETITGIVRKRFRVSLSRNDGRQENEDALDLCQEIRTVLIEKLVVADGKPILNIRHYAAGVAYHRIAQHFRNTNPEWHSLKNRLRYFLEKHPGYGVWADDDGELFCGFIAWRQRRKSPPATQHLETLYGQSQTVLPPALSGRTVENLKRKDWEELFDALFKHLDSPIELDEVVSVVADVLGIKETRQAGKKRDPEMDDPPPDPPDPGPGPEGAAIRRQYLRILWGEICQLRPLQRLAYLLNFRDADGDIHLFVYYEVVSEKQIGVALNLSNEQFARAWQMPRIPEDERPRLQTLKGYDDKFAALYVLIPLDDMEIAQLLGGERQQVINLRRLARDFLEKKMAPFK